MRSWTMYGGILPSKSVFINIGSDPRFAQMHGHPEPVEVIVTETEDGEHYGWIEAKRPDGPPVMIQPHPGMFSMQFPYGPEAAQERGDGCVVRLSVVRSAT